jgi:hypothetical protein
MTSYGRSPASKLAKPVNSTEALPTDLNRSRARRTDSGSGSTPATLVDTAASRWTSSPSPHPTSSTRPWRRAAMPTSQSW